MRVMMATLFLVFAMGRVRGLDAALSAAPSLGLNAITNLLGILPLNLAAGASVPIGLKLNAPGLFGGSSSSGAGAGAGNGGNNGGDSGNGDGGAGASAPAPNSWNGAGAGAGASAGGHACLLC